MSQIKRKSKAIDELVDLLDERMDRSERVPEYLRRATAFSLLSSAENEVINAEIRKCAMSHRYYMENYHVIKTEYEGLSTVCGFWDSQEIFLEKIEEIQMSGRPVKVVVLKARQLGLSTISEALVFHKTLFTDSCNMLIVAQDPSQTDYLFGMSRLAYDQLPWWMQPERRYEAKGKYMVFDREDPSLRQSNPGMNSAIYVEAANKISGVARGKTIRAGHLSEISSWPRPEVLVEQIFPAMNAPDTIIIMESTAKGRNNFFHRFWKDAVDGEIDWEPIFIEFFRVKKYLLPIPRTETFKITDEEAALRSKVLREKDIYVKDEQFYWRRNKMKEFISIQGDEWKFFQEFPSATWQEAFQGSGLCAFDKRKLQTLLETTCAKPKWIGEIEYAPQKPHTPYKLLLEKLDEKTPFMPPAEQYGSRLRVWEEPEPDENYYIAGDVAMGIPGGDYSCAQVLKIGHGLEPDVQVAEWHGWVDPEPYGDVIVALAEWYNHCQVAVECNDIGIQTNNRIFRQLEYDNIFRWKHYDKVKNFMSDYFGWYTNSKTRDQIICKTRVGISQNTLVVRSEDLVEEMIDFAQDEGSDRFEGQNANDDRVMAMQIAYWCAHDSDYGKDAAATPRSDIQKRGSQFVVFDQFNRATERVATHEEAEKIVAGRPGWRFQQTISMRDYSNSDYSPVYDKTGPRSRMHESGVPTGAISLDSLNEPTARKSEDDWKNY